MDYAQTIFRTTRQRAPYKHTQVNLAVSLCLLVGFSQTADAQRTREKLEEVVVTASPIGSGRDYAAVSLYSEDQLFEMNAMSLGEMLDGEPGLGSRSFGGAPARPVIRGFDGPRMLIIENGERMGDIQDTAPDHAVTLDPLGMNRIEVVRGPASLLYGSSALGGVINIFTNDFARDWDEGQSGGVAVVHNTNNNSMSAASALTVGGESTALTLRAQWRENGNTRTPSGRLPNSQLDSLSGSLGLAHRTERFSGGVSIRHLDTEYGIPEFASFSDPDNPGRFIETEPDLEIRIKRVNLQAHGTWQLDGFFRELELRNSLSRSTQEEGEPNPAPEDLELRFKTETISSSALLKHEQWAIFDAGFIGTTLHRRKQEIDGNEAFSPGEDLWNLALYTMQETELSERLSLQVGLRLEREWLEGVENRFFGQEGLVDEKVWNIAGSVGLNYLLNEEWSMGLQFARGHRNPTVLERAADGWHAGATRVELGTPGLSPEIGYGADFITRYEGATSSLEMNLFYVRIDNYVVLEQLPANCGGIDYRVRADRENPNCVRYSGGDAEQYGFELRGDYSFTDTLSADVTFDYVRGARRDISEPLPFMPPLRARLGLTWQDGNWRVSGNVRYVASQKRVAENELPTGSFTIARLEAGYRLAQGTGEHAFNLRIDNLFDTSYQDHLNIVRRFLDPQLGPDAPSRFDMPGRNIMLSYRYSF
jgi:iron complex outermembrane receptor protein